MSWSLARYEISWLTAVRIVYMYSLGGIVSNCPHYVSAKADANDIGTKLKGNININTMTLALMIVARQNNRNSTG